MEEGTTGQNGTLTGLSHIKDLGVTHVELLPLYCFGGVDEANPSSAYIGVTIHYITTHQRDFMLQILLTRITGS